MRDKLRRNALVLSYFTVGYNIIEGIVSIIAGTMAQSIALYSFGIDSFIESLSGVIMIWRFSNHSGKTTEREELLERRSLNLVGVTFFIFALYVIFESLKKLYFIEKPEVSFFGIIIALASIIMMPILFIAKYKTGMALGSKALVADSKETLACFVMSLSLLLGLGLNYFFGLWWADPAVGIVIAGFLIKEGYEIVFEKDDD